MVKDPQSSAQNSKNLIVVIFKQSVVYSLLRFRFQHSSETKPTSKMIKPITPTIKETKNSKVSSEESDSKLLEE